jgi:hypothetical protein
MHPIDWRSVMFLAAYGALLSLLGVMLALCVALG